MLIAQPPLSVFGDIFPFIFNDLFPFYLTPNGIILTRLLAFIFSAYLPASSSGYCSFGPLQFLICLRRGSVPSVSLSPCFAALKQVVLWSCSHIILGKKKQAALGNKAFSHFLSFFLSFNATLFCTSNYCIQLGPETFESFSQLQGRLIPIQS